jgi:nucleotide-binding universal stress UspA family protein
MNLTSLPEFRALVAGDEWATFRAIRSEEGWLSKGRQSTTLPRSEEAKSWPEQSLAAPRLLLRSLAGSRAALVHNYAHHLSYLLGASFDHTHPLDKTHYELETGEPIPDYDLMIMAEPHQSWAERLVFGSPIYRSLVRVPTSLLVARRPRWPLHEILLIVRSEAVHSLAVNWTIRLAQASGAVVTVLVVVPQVSPIRSREVRLQQGLAMLLSGDSLLERQIKYVSQCLEAKGLEALLRLREGFPEQQIRAELSTDSYDLVVVAAESQDWWLRRLVGESVEPVLSRANCPVLIAKPRQA